MHRVMKTMNNNVNWAVRRPVFRLKKVPWGMRVSAHWQQKRVIVYVMLEKSRHDRGEEIKAEERRCEGSCLVVFSCWQEYRSADDGWHVQGQRSPWLTAQARRAHGFRPDSRDRQEGRRPVGEWLDVRIKELKLGGVGLQYGPVLLVWWWRRRWWWRVSTSSLVSNSQFGQLVC